jgi:hypothetical protein
MYVDVLTRYIGYLMNLKSELFLIKGPEVTHKPVEYYKESLFCITLQTYYKAATMMLNLLFCKHISAKRLQCASSEEIKQSNLLTLNSLNFQMYAWSGMPFTNYNPVV